MADSGFSITTWRVYQLASTWLIVRFAWAVFIPGGEWPMPPWHYLSMGLDLMLLLAVLVVRSQLFAAAPEDQRRSTANILFTLALIGGVGLLLIRLTSNAAWWTGHLF